MNINQSTQHRFVQLAKMREKIFHTNDLANIWQITNKNNLYTTLKRYTQKGFLNRIYKGLYSIEPLNRLDPYLLGVKALHSYAYISAETVLAQAGIIQQKINYITIISSQSKRFGIGEFDYYSRQLKDKYLYQDIGIIKKDEVNFATPERAVADLLHFNPKAYFDARDKINRSLVKKIQKTIGYKVINI